MWSAQNWSLPEREWQNERVEHARRIEIKDSRGRWLEERIVEEGSLGNEQPGYWTDHLYIDTAKGYDWNSLKESDHKLGAKICME